VAKPTKPSKKNKSAPKAPPNKRAPEQTFEEVRYIKHLIDNSIPVCVRLTDNKDVEGTVEYYDANFIRLTRSNDPNLFIFKHDIKYIFELPE
jgi:sRNA-binding regulator protein Hfq